MIAACRVARRALQARRRRPTAAHAAHGGPRRPTAAPREGGPEGLQLAACVGQRLEDPKVEIEELLDRATAQLLASAEARDQLEHVRLAQREAEREGPEEEEGG